MHTLEQLRLGELGGAHLLRLHEIVARLQPVFSMETP
jgi:hypothetical protein